MCVVYACATARPDDRELHRGCLGNPHGAGIAWIEGKRVHWLKGLKDSEEVIKFLSERKPALPYMIHFRTASVGGQDPALTHPFPILPAIPLDLSGSTDKCVLFHNGHIASWEDYAFRAGLASQEDFPEGVWSDSRALAWLIYLKGTGILRFVLGSSRSGLLYPDGDPKDPWTYMDLRGSWEDMETDTQGWTQSSSTISKSYGRGHWDSGKCLFVKDDDEDAGKAVVVITDGDAKSTSCGAAAEAASSSVNVWTVEELTTLLASLEKELSDARSAAGV